LINMEKLFKEKLMNLGIEKLYRSM